MQKTSFIVIRGNSMRLDGGTMFGNAPKTLWQKWVPADEKGMIDIASNCLLVKTGNHNLLFETGCGAYFSPDMKRRFAVKEESHILMHSLAEQGLSDADISHVVLTHLHFDHAGGLLSAWEPDREPALLFPNALFVVGEENFKRSKSPHYRDRASFIPGLAEKLQATGRLVLKQGGDRMVVGCLTIEFFQSQGHTPGMLVPWIQAQSGTVIYTADLIPGLPWVNLPITMGYDRFPEGLVDEKKQMLDRAVDEDALLVFPHDPIHVAARVKMDPVKKRVMPSQLFETLNTTL
ncbi:MBL fold metallo-hydrolase [Desulfobacter curvatus]|uniref:MBL fold metallo-hydrolase n=1 Tax=Desulfobacter curvatus TaxID=2290 RepID=UPI00036FFBF9|nr:MBL fold metallo-hydrolase [Desulfobacter curvatus]